MNTNNVEFLLLIQKFYPIKSNSAILYLIKILIKLLIFEICRSFFLISDLSVVYNPKQLIIFFFFWYFEKQFLYIIFLINNLIAFTISCRKVTLPWICYNVKCNDLFIFHKTKVTYLALPIWRPRQCYKPVDTLPTSVNGISLHCAARYIKARVYIVRGLPSRFGAFSWYDHFNPRRHVAHSGNRRP